MFSIVRAADRRTFWLGGQRQALIVDASQTNGRYALSHSTMAPGVGAGEHSHSREAEAFYVLAGRVRFWLAGQTFVLGRGDHLHAEPGLKYRFEVLAPETAEVLILYAPAGLERFVTEAGIADPAGPQEAQRAFRRSIEQAPAVMAAAPAYGVRYSAAEPKDS
jgi:quercetin dioxygenase-like cupin family protein